MPTWRVVLKREGRDHHARQTAFAKKLQAALLESGLKVKLLDKRTLRFSKERRLNGDYRLIYDVTQKLPPVWFPAMGLVALAVALLDWRFGKAPRGFLRGPLARKFSVGFCALWTIIVATAVLGGNCSARRTLASGGAGIVEGAVEDFHPMPYNGHDTERFRVGAVQFAYSDYDLAPGFNNTSSHGGPIREGLMVRIHYGGKPSHATILQLEVRE